MRKLIGLAVLAALFAMPVLAQREDSEGCKDSPLLSRMSGCTIDTCDNKDFDQTAIAVGLDESGMLKTNALEGSVDRIEYTCPGNLSGIGITRNAENALKAAGFTIVYSGMSESDRPAVTARKANTWINVTNTGQDSMTYYSVTVVHTKALPQEMIASADTMEDEINRSGSVSLYGINFDTGKAAIKPGSEQTLAEIAKLLKKNPDWKVQVEGHTDNAGAKDANMKLSQTRAEAVRSWLVTNGIDGGRLVAKGFGDTKPAADNSSEEGRAKNRRVALVKL